MEIGSVVIKLMLGIYFVLFFIALFAIAGCTPYRSREKVQQTTIKMEGEPTCGEEFNLVDDEMNPENVYYIKFVHVVM